MNILTELANKYCTDKGDYSFSDKTKNGHGYTEMYNNLFYLMTNQPIVLLEVGIARGASLLMWNEYFPKAKIIGVDISLNYIDTSRPLGIEGGGWNDKSRENIQLHVMDQTDPKLKTLVLDNNVDIFIDDGSHRAIDQIATFTNIYPILKSGSFYVTEDIHCNFLETNSFYSHIIKLLSKNEINSLLFTINNLESMMIIFKKQ